MRTDCTYETAKELLEDIISDGEYGELLEVIRSFTEKEAAVFAQRLKRVSQHNEKFILKDNREH